MTAAVERFVEVGDARLWSISTGSGPAIVMVNGGPGCDDYLGPVAEMLSDSHRVIRVEPRGCGRSSWDGRYQLDTTVDDLDVLRNAYGIDHWVLCGHSAGVDVALVYALRYRQRTVGVIGLAGGRMVNDREWSRQYHEQLATRGEEASQAFHSDPLVNQAGNRDWKALVQQPDLFRRLADLDAPCAFITAGNDVSLNWPTEQLARLVRRGRYVELPGASHDLWRTHPTPSGPS